MAGGKKILFISPMENGVPRRYEHFPSGAFLLMGTMLQQRGHDVKVIHMVADRKDLAAVRREVETYRPDYVGITMSTYQTRLARAVSRAVKEVSASIPVIVGGPHPSALGLRIFRDFPCVDIVVIGEGEHTFLDIIEGKNLASVPGICYAGKANPPRQFAPDLDYIPLPNLDLVDIKRFTGSDPQIAYPSMFIMASRGCPFQCTFCNKSVWGNRVRFRKPELVIDEVRWLHERYGMREVYFQDDTFNLNRDWAERIFRLIIQHGLHKKMVFTTSFRANRNLVDLDLLKLAKAAGFWLIFYGVENGNQAMLDHMGKGLTKAEIKRAIDLTHQVGIKTKCSFMIGLPGENEQTINDTIAFWRELHPFITGIGPVIPFPGSEYDREVEALGHKLTHDYDEFGANDFVVRTAELDKDQIRHHLLRFRKIILHRFIVDFLKMRYLGVLLYGLKSPHYIWHVLRRIASFTDI